MDQLLYDWDINGDQQEMQYNCVVWLVKVRGIRAANILYISYITQQITNIYNIVSYFLKFIW